MNQQLIVVLALLGICIALFVANQPRMEVVALLAMVALPLVRVGVPFTIVALVLTVILVPWLLPFRP